MHLYINFHNNLAVIVYIICQMLIAYLIGRKIFNNKIKYIRQRFFLYGVAPFFFIVNVSCLVNTLFPRRYEEKVLAMAFSFWLIVTAVFCGMYMVTRLWKLTVKLAAKIFAFKVKKNIKLNLPAYLDETYLKGKIVKQINNFENHLNQLRIEHVDLDLGQRARNTLRLKVLQLTDLHIGAYFHPDRAEKVVEISNQQGCGLILLTGDFINLDRRLVGTCVDILSKLKAPLGVYGCLGNHERITGTEDLFTKELRLRGISILRNGYQRIDVDGEDLYIMGVDCFSSARRYREICSLFHEIPDYKTLVLCHNPNYFPIFAHYNAAAMFSGHTHGGQIKFEVGPAVLAPSLLLSPYLHGHYCINKSHLYVSRGVGTSGAPIRIFCPPELTVFNMRIGSLEQ